MNARVVPCPAEAENFSEATAPAPYVPPELPHAAALSRLFGRAPIRFAAAGAEISARFVPDEDGAEGGSTGSEQEWTRLRWMLGGFAGTLDVPASVISHLVASVEPAPLAPLGTAARCLLTELALAPQIEALETLTGCGLRLDPAAPGLPGPSVAIALEGSFGDAPLHLRLGLPVGALGLLAGLADRLPRERAFEAADAVPVALAVRVGTARLGAALLATAAPGDALLLREAPQAGNRLVVVAGERYAAPAWLDSARAVLEGPLRPAAQLGWEDWAMPDATLANAEEAAAEGVEPPDAAMDDLQVTLVFELGRRPATLAELRGLAAGHVIELDRGGLSGPVDILANGRRIGRGELIRVGDALAVRVLRLAAHG